MDNETITYFEIIIFIANIILFFISKKTYNFLYQDDSEQANLRIKSSLYLNGSLIILQIYHVLIKFEIIQTSFDKTSMQILYTIATLYSMMLGQSIIHYLIKRKLGKIEKVDNKEIAADTPSSRMWSLVMLIVIIFTTIYINIQIWSAASLMETTGIVGITLGALALTNSVWFPDIYGGIVILKNKSFSVGDVVFFDDDEKELYIVNKATFFHLELLSIVSNNRTTIPNNLLTTFKTHNLSKVATQQGLRKTITYKIGYPEHLSNEKAKEKLIEMKKDKRYVNIDLNINMVKEKLMSDYIEKIRKIAIEAQEHILKQENKINYLSEHEFKIGILNTGDHAIEFILSYYIKPMSKSFVTEKIREYLIRTPLAVNEAMLLKSYKYGIDLSTPITYSKV
jgi:hypothetical protein